MALLGATTFGFQSPPANAEKTGRSQPLRSEASLLRPAFI
jgi:hypothetical protein